MANNTAPNNSMLSKRNSSVYARNFFMAQQGKMKILMLVAIKSVDIRKGFDSFVSI